MVDFIVTPDVRHLAVRVTQDPHRAQGYEGYWQRTITRALCGEPSARRSYTQYDWSHLDPSEAVEVLGSHEYRKWRLALSRPVCLQCLRTVGQLVAATTTGVQR